MLNAEELQAKLEAAQSREEINKIIIDHSRSIHDALDKASKIIMDYKFTMACLCRILDYEFGGVWSDDWTAIQENIKTEEAVSVEILEAENKVFIRRKYGELENPNDQQKG